jgi:hypothetical protein
MATATVTNCGFTGNLARAGNECKSPTSIAGDAGGGAIASFALTSGPTVVAKLDVSYSQFSKNQAIGGSDNQSLFLPGHAFGGAVASHRFKGSAELKVSHCIFDQNKVIGGNHNVVTAAVQGDDRGVPNTAAAGGVSAIGTGMISDSTFVHNEAIGGQGVAGSVGIPITKNGGDSSGGGIGVAFPNTEVTVSKCTVKHNAAIGGQAGAGGTGGEARGGGVSNTGTKLTVTGGSIIDSNQAKGGNADASDSPSKGGDGLGGGVYHESGSTMTVTACSITHNSATGGKGMHGGTDGRVVGRGLYSLGELIVDPATVIS